MLGEGVFIGFQDCKQIVLGVIREYVVKDGGRQWKRVGGIPILYKSVSPCLDVTSGSFASGRGPVDVGIAELRNQFSRVIYIIPLI